MTDKVNKILQLGLVVVLAISLVLFVVFYINGESMTETVINWAFVLLGITVVLLFVFPIVGFINNPKAGVKVLIVLAGFAVLYGISWSMASGDNSAAIYEKSAVTTEVSRMIGAALISAYFIVGITLVTMVYASIAKAFK